MYGLDRLLFFERIDHSNLFKYNDHHLCSNDVDTNRIESDMSKNREKKRNECFEYLTVLREDEFQCYFFFDQRVADRDCLSRRGNIIDQCQHTRTCHRSK